MSFIKTAKKPQAFRIKALFETFKSPINIIGVRHLLKINFDKYLSRCFVHSISFSSMAALIFNKSLTRFLHFHFLDDRLTRLNGFKPICAPWSIHLPQAQPQGLQADKAL